MDRDYTKVQLVDNSKTFGHSDQHAKQQTIFTELKLSEILLQDVDNYKRVINQKNEEVEVQKIEVLRLNKIVKESHKIILGLKTKLKE